MLLLAKTAKAALFKCGKEYWIVESDFKTHCVNEQSAKYNALNAFGYFVEKYGESTAVAWNIGKL